MARPDFQMTRIGEMRTKRLAVNSAQLVTSRSQRDANFSYLEQYNCIPPPIFILAVTAVEISLYVFYVVDMHYGISVSGPVPVQSPLIYDPCKRQEAWRFLTYTFIHAGICHILFNSIAQLALGIPLELVHKFWRVGLVYLLGVLSGSLAVSVADPQVYVAGASGGCYALMAAHFSNLIVVRFIPGDLVLLGFYIFGLKRSFDFKNWAEMECALQQLICLFLLLATDIAIAMYNRFGDTGLSQRISYAAHVGGLVAGLLMGVVVLRNFRQKTWERVVWWIALTGFWLLIVSCILWNFYCPQCCKS